MSEWISIGLACPTLGSADATARRREEVRKLIGARLLKARAFRPQRRTTEFDRSCDLEIFAEVARRGTLDLCRLPFGNTVLEKTEEGTGEVSLLEIGGTPIETSRDWVSVVSSDFTIRQSRSNWELGHFHRRTLMYSSPVWGHEESVGFVYMETDAYSVEVEVEALEKLLGLRIDATEVAGQGRATKFDWEAAFADVAARFYHDIQFDDLEAKGVQSQIIDLLRASFESRGLAVPTDDTLKPKARKLLGALRAKKP